MSIKISLLPPSAQEYCELRQICNLSIKTLEAATLALPKSLYTITLRNEGHLIGMGRLIGDVGTAVQVVDIAVHPDFQKQGLSRLIMESIINFINANVPECALVSLFADVDYLYEKFGFYRPENSHGMFLKR